MSNNPCAGITRIRFEGYRSQPQAPIRHHEVWLRHPFVGICKGMHNDSVIKIIKQKHYVMHPKMSNFADAMNGKIKGYSLACIAAATYGLNPLFALPLYTAGMNPDSVLFLRYLFAIPMIGIMIVMRGQSFRITVRELGSLVLMGVLMAFSSLALFMSYNYMDAGLASTILFVYPIMVALIMSIFFKEKMTGEIGLCIVLAVTGIALLQNNTGGTENASIVGTLLSIGSGLSYAIYIVCVNKTRLRDVATLTVTFYVLVFGLTVFGGRLAMESDFVLPSSRQWYLWGCVIALALFPTAISFICTTSAIHIIGSTSTAILGALEPVTAVVVGVAVFGESLTAMNVIGLVAIIVAVSVVVAAPGIHYRLVKVRKLFPKLRRSCHNH